MIKNFTLRSSLDITLASKSDFHTTFENICQKFDLQSIFYVNKTRQFVTFFMLLCRMLKGLF